MIREETRLPLSLLLLRVGVFIVMALWSVDKLLNPQHAGAVFETYYLIGGLGPTTLAVIGAGQLLVEIAFVAGLFRTFTYGFVLVTHGISTLASWPGYIEPFDNLLFFAAWPMLAACVALFLLREQDTLWAADELLRREAGPRRTEAAGEADPPEEMPVPAGR